MPLQRVVERDALTDQPLAVIDQQPQVELGTFQLRRRQLGEAFAQRRLATAIASMLSDFPRSRPPRRAAAINLVGTRTTRSPRSIRKRSKEPDTCRQSSSAQTRSPSSPRAQTNERVEPSDADLDRSLAQQLAGCQPNRGDRVRALVHVRTEHDH